MHLLIVEDNPRIRCSLELALREKGYSVVSAASGREAHAVLSQPGKPWLVVLDLGLPDIDGMELLAEIRQTSPAMPVIILTARDAVADRVEGLESGADDYLVKPFALPELVARIRALERRIPKPPEELVQIGDLSLDLLRRTAQRGGTTVALTPKEYDLLHFFCRHRGETVSREMLAREVFGIASHVVPFDNIIDVHVSNLRKKIDAEHPDKLLHTLRGIGFVLEDRP